MGAVEFFLGYCGWRVSVWYDRSVLLRSQSLDADAGFSHDSSLFDVVSVARVDMTIRTSCSACGVKLKVEDHLAGRTVRCPSCQQPIEIPRAEACEDIFDPFAEDAEAMMSPLPPPPAAPPLVKPPATERKSAKPKRKPPSVVDQAPAAPQPPAKLVRQVEPAVEADFEPPVEEEPDYGEFPNLSEDELRGELISPPRRRKKKLVSKLADSELTAPAPTTLRRSKTPVATPISNSGWRWHLHWGLVIALLPLVFYPFLSSKEGLEDRLDQTLKNHPEINPAAIDSAGSLNDLAMQLPDQRIEGAWLPADTYWHWGLALASSGVFLGLLSGMWPDGEPRLRMLVMAGLATGTVGILLLLGFQWVALHTDGVLPRGRRIAILLFYIVKFIGFSYRCAMDSSGGFLQSFFGYTLGVGLCEELCKTIPVVIYLNSDPRQQRLRTACLVGLASGVGFGVSEGITYSVDYYNGIMDFWVYLVRFASCVSLHAIWAGGVAVLMATNQDHLDFSWEDVVGFVAFYLSPAMILHGLYNTLLTHRHDYAATVCAVASFVWLQWLLRRHAPAD